MGLIVLEANLADCPTLLAKFAELRDDLEKLPVKLQHVITTGDKHGNTLRLIDELVKTGVLDINPDQYIKLKHIYDRHIYLLRILEDENASDAKKNNIKVKLAQHIESFHKIISSLTVHKHLLTREIGDLFSDRGNQDLFTLFVFDRLICKPPFKVYLTELSIKFFKA